MYALAEFAIRLLARYGALIAFVAVAILLVISLAAFARVEPRPALTHGWSMAAMAAVLSLAALAAPAWSGVGALRAAYEARGRALPAPSGQFAVEDIRLTLDGDRPVDLRLWFPSTTVEPLRSRRFILFAPGIGGDADQNALLAAEIASHGYVVAAFDDLSRTLPRDSDVTANVREGRFDFATPAALEETLRMGDTRVALEADFARDVLDRFSAIANERDTPWGGRVDVGRIGFVGYSFGGSTAAETSIADPRIAAVVNLDGSPFGRAAREGVDAPYLLVLSDMRQRTPIPHALRRSVEYRMIEREYRLARAQARRPDSEAIEIRFASHAALTDEYFNADYFPAWLKLDPFRAHDIVRSRVVDFLRRRLPPGGSDAEAAPRRPRQFDEVLELGRSA